MTQAIIIYTRNLHCMPLVHKPTPMASWSVVLHCLLLLLLSCLLFLNNLSPSAAKPHALVLPVKKDAATLQYVTRINLGSPSTLLNFVVDLGGRTLWLNCDSNPSSSYQSLHCNTPQCGYMPSPFACVDNSSSCTVFVENPYENIMGSLSLETASFVTTDGSCTGPTASDNDFIFACGSASLLKGLACGVSGMAGFGRNRVGMPIQLAVAFGLQPKFALCLSSSTSYDGVIFVGDGAV